MSNKVMQSMTYLPRHARVRVPRGLLCLTLGHRARFFCARQWGHSAWTQPYSTHLPNLKSVASSILEILELKICQQIEGQTSHTGTIPCSYPTSKHYPPRPLLGMAGKYRRHRSPVFWHTDLQVATVVIEIAQLVLSQFRNVLTQSTENWVRSIHIQNNQ